MTHSQLLPGSVPDRLAHVGTALFGRFWKERLAAGLGISRPTLNDWLRGAYKRTRDVDGEVLSLFDAESDACAARMLEINALRRKLTEIRDAD